MTDSSTEDDGLEQHNKAAQGEIERFYREYTELEDKIYAANEELKQCAEPLKATQASLKQAKKQQFIEI